jgi:hypothetical protein
MVCGDVRRRAERADYLENDGLGHWLRRSPWTRSEKGSHTLDEFRQPFLITTLSRHRPLGFRAQTNLFLTMLDPNLDICKDFAFESPLVILSSTSRAAARRHKRQSSSPSLSPAQPKVSTSTCGRKACQYCSLGVLSSITHSDYCFKRRLNALARAGLYPGSNQLRRGKRRALPGDKTSRIQGESGCSLQRDTFHCMAKCVDKSLDLA